jgi:hypothetical protein
MAQQIINTGANANDGTGEPLREAFTAVNDNFTEIYTAGPVGTDVRIVGNTITTLQINQNLTLKPNGIGLIQANATVVPSVNLVYDLGSVTKQWDSVYAGYFIGNGALLTGVVGGNASNSFSTISANGVNIVANSSTGVLTLTPGNNITIAGSAGSNTVTFGVSASPSFSGNVSGGNFLTGGTVSAAGNITGANLRTTGSISTAGNITANNVVFSGNLVGNISTTGNIIAGNVISTQAIIAASDITSAANITGSYIFGNGAFLTGISGGAGNYSNANVSAFLPTYTGNVSAAYFIGNGSQLTSITGANVVGIVPRANIANVAYSVSAANIVGNIANATYAEFANLAYNAYGNGIIGSVGSANTANIANVAYSVSGANVVGTVANATYAVSAGSAGSANTAGQANIANIANVAYSVAGANVTGTVANAVHAEYANLAYYAFGNGIIGSVATANTANIANIANVAYSVSGANVVGTVANATYAVSAGSANTANRANIANVAYSVAGANVTGNVANATYAEYANLAYYAFGNGIVGQISTTSNIIAGNISTTGNVTGTYFIGNGSQLTGVVATDIGVLANLSVTGNAQIGNVRTAGQVSAAGNVTTGNYFVGNGAFLTGIVASAGSEILYACSSVRIGGANANVTVSVNAVSNVAVFTTGGMSTTGNITANANVLANGQISALGNVTGNYIFGNGALLTGVITSVANINNGTSNVTVVSSGGNITVGVNGSGNVVVFANTGAYVDGVISASGNISANYFIGNGSQLTGVTASSINAAALTGNTLSSNVLYSSLTQVGNLANLSVVGNTISGNLSTAGIVSAAGNISANYFIGNGSQLTGIDATSIQNGNSNVKVYANGNVSTSISGISNVVVVSDTGQYVTGLISATGNITGANVSTGILSAAGNATAGNVLTGGVISATSTITSAANITGANLITSGLATVTGNITGGNLLTAGVISATGNITGGNLSAVNLVINNIASDDSSYVTIEDGLTVVGEISAAGNVTGSNVNTNNIVGTGLTITSTGLLNLAPTGNITVNAKNINNLADPVQDQDAATKAYVDTVAQGLDPKASVAYATVTTLPAYTYNNGTAGVGATITGTATGLLTIDGTAPTVGDRILIKNETSTNAPYNGIYTVTTNSVGSAYVLTRATDFNQSSEIPSAFTFVEYGTINGDTGWVCTTNAPVVVGTTDIVFVQFSGAGSYTANTAAGLSLIGSQFNAKVDENTTSFDGSGNIIVKAGANLTTPNIGAATGTSLSVTGNATAANLNAVGLSLSGNVVSTLNVTGNIAGGNITTPGLISATGNVSGNYFLGNGSQLTGVIAAGGQGNTITLGTPTDGNLTGNDVAYQGWTTSTFVTDGLDDLNQVALNIAGNTFVGNTYITANVSSGPSPLSVALTGRYIGNPNAYLWQFGDGTANATTANAVHTFSNVSGGTFTVTYTAFNTNGTYAGNAANGAKGSTSTATTTITLYTPTPIPSFTANRTSLDTPGGVLITNTSQYAETYSINWGDGTIVIPANNWTTASHTFTNSAANTDVLYGVNLTGNSANAGASPVSVTSANTNVKVYSSQASNVFFTANVANVINGLGTISFRNDSNGAPGNTASFGAQQLYSWNYGDGNISNVNIQAGLAGNPGAANVTKTFTLSAANQSGNNYEQYTANLWLYTGHSTSPFKSGNITITIEPQTRANYIGTTANVITDATANTGNARVGYLYTDYTGANRSTFTFQNTSQNSNIANWTWGDGTFSNGVSNVGNVLKTYTSTGAKTVTLQANGTPNGITNTAQSNSFSVTGYIFIANNPTAPTDLSGFANLAIANASQFTNAPLLAAGAADATGGNIPANGASVTRFATTTPVMTYANVVNANTSTTGTLAAYVNNANAGGVALSVAGNAVTASPYGALVVSADRDLHVANAAVPSYFYKVFSANISCALANLSTGYNNYKLVHSTSGNTNYVGFVKDNLNSAPTLVTSNVVMVEATAGTYRYISGIPYYNTGSPTITIANVEVQNLAGQTYTSTTPFTLASGTVLEGSGAVLSANQTKTLAQIDNAANSMLTGSNVKANIGIGTNYTLGNLTATLGGSNNSVSTLQANILNVIGTSTTVQLPANVQMYAGANSGINEQAIVASTTGNTQVGVRIVMSTAGNTPVFDGSINYYTANVWSGAQTIAGTPEAVTRYGNVKHFATNLATGYLPVGPNLNTGRSGTQYFTFAFRRPSLANFDIILTTTTGIAGLWVALPGTTIDTGGFTSPTPGFPGPTSTINGWLEGFTQNQNAGPPGNSATGGNPSGTNGCAVTGADVIPLNTAISNQRYTMTFGTMNASYSTGNNMLIRIALSSGQTLSDLQIGLAT